MSEFFNDLRKQGQKFYTNYLSSHKHSNKELSELIKHIKYTRSTYRRLSIHIQQLKYTYILPKTSMICTSFKANVGSTECIYGYMYSDGSQPMYDSLHKYLCIGGTFMSQDGEYRHRFVTFDKIEYIKTKFKYQWDLIEDLILRRMQNQLKLRVDIFYPSNSHVNVNEFEENINSSRVAIAMFILCWLGDYHKIQYKIIENHINVAYQTIIYNPDDIDVMLKMNKNTTFEESEQLLRAIGSVHPVRQHDSSKTTMMGMITGQKLFPLTNREITDHLDIKSNVWREHYIAVKCNDLVINLVSLSFPIFNDWFLIQNTHPGIFDNPTQYAKFIHGKIADDMTEKLSTIDALAYESSELSNPRLKSRKFGELSRMINRSIEYADDEISMSDVTLCMHSEYVGRTVRDLPALSRISKGLFRYSSIFDKPDIFAGCMFEWLYGLYCTNTILGTMHGDLHINNATIHNVFIFREEETKYKMYVIDGGSPSLMYIFKHIGVFAMLIVFSRVIIGNIGMIQNDFGEAYADTYFDKQSPRILRLIAYHFPDLFAANESAIEDLVKKEEEGNK